GIDYYLTPDFLKLFHFKVWLSAYAQVFFSLSLAQGILITYASFLRKESDITNNAFIISLADAGTSFLAGFAVFGIVGYLSLMKGIGIENLGLAGPHLTFVTYPTAISLLPFGAWLFGMIFYIALLAFGIDSAFSMIEPFATSINSKWKFSKGKATAIACALGFLSSLIFVTGGGIYWLDIVDHFVANFCLVLIGLLECISLGYLFDLKKLREHANEVSDITIGRWWDVLIKFVAPLSLLILLVASVVENISVPYNDYPTWCLLVGGVIPGVAIFIFSFVFARR
ncbi:MAG: sodium-dependent transporter, partial [Thermoplasmata archaeon]|nr:sodium-dependent transporter [Thermoplasmata archaeon]